MTNAQKLTVLDERGGHLVFLGHQPKVERSTVTHLIIGVVKTPSEKNGDTRLDLGILLSNAKLRESRHSSSTNDGILQNNAVVDVTNVLGRVRGLGTFHTEKMQDSDRQLGEFAVLNELTEMCES